MTPARPRRASMLATLAAIALTLASPLSAQIPSPVEMDGSRPARCGAGIPEGEARGYIPLPRGDVFCPLIADPKGVNSFVSYLRGDAKDFATDVGSVGIADVLGLFRYGTGGAGDGVQLSLAGGVFAQFDIGTSSYDLINADYLLGVPLTIRASGFSTRLRIYHQSSHLGDEFLLRSEHPERENLSFESVELLLSQDIGLARVYAGGEYFLDRQPRSLPLKLGHAGLELRPRNGARFGSVGTLRLIAAADVKAVSDTSAWNYGVSARAGFEVGRGREGPVPSRRWSLLFEFYDGPSPYGQFFNDQVRLMGLGFHFTP